MKLSSILATFALPLVANAAANTIGNDEVQTKSSPTPAPFAYGAAICTFAPDEVCFPNTSGFPPCCSTLGGSCQNGARSPADIACATSVCTNHGYGCYKSKGMPMCCTKNGGSGCTLYDDVGCDMYLPPPPSPPPTPSHAPGSNVCTLPPNYNCYPQHQGYPRCCKTSSGCPSHFTPSNPPPCDTPGLEVAFRDQLAEFDVAYDGGADYDVDIEDEDVDFETEGYLRG